MFIDHQSAPTSTGALDLFSTPPTQVAIQNGWWDCIKCMTGVSSAGPWEFRVQPDPHFLQLSKNYLYLKLKIVRSDMTDMVDDTIGPINLLGKTFIKQCKVSVNGKLAFDSGDNYAYRALLETELNYGSEAKKTYLSAAGYRKDDPAMKVNSALNTGWEWRCKPYRKSKSVELMAPLHVDFFMTDRVFPNNVELSVQLYRNNDDFCLMGFGVDKTYKIVVQNIQWFVRKIELLPSINLALEAHLRKKPMKYPIRRIEVTKFTVSGGRSIPTRTLFTSQIPRRLVIGCVDSEAYHGDVSKSPFLFKNSNVEQIRITAGGQIWPREPMDLDFENNLYIRAYIQMIEAMNISGEDAGNDISLKEFKHATCLFLFDLNPDGNDNSSWDLIKQGTTTLDLKFSKDLGAANIEILVYSEFENLMSIDRHRNIFFDYSG